MALDTFGNIINTGKNAYDYPNSTYATYKLLSKLLKNPAKFEHLFDRSV